MISVFARAALDGAVFAALVWLTIRAFPRLTASARAMLWWAATAKFLVALAWVAPVPVAVLPAATYVPAAATSIGMGPSRQEAVKTESSSPPASPPVERDWTPMLAAVWAFGVCVSLTSNTARWLRRRHAVRSSSRADAALVQTAREVGAIIGLERVPDIRVSAWADSPCITGIRRPVVLVPPRFTSMSAEQQRMTLCHELAHIKRGDLWLGLAPALAERLFFFHPCARLAAREYAFWREVACDAAVLAALNASPQTYGRLLLDLGVSPGRAPLAPAGAAWSFFSMKRRIVMLRHPSTPSVGVRVMAVAVLAVAAAGLAPFRLVARSSEAMIPRLNEATPLAVPAAQSTPARPLADRSDAEPELQSSPDRELRFVYMRGEQTTMSGSTRDIERARRARTSGEPLLWFYKDGKEYIVRDPAILEEVSRIWGPVNRVGDEQGKVGEKQGAIGARQGALGAKQGEIGAQQGAIGERQSAIGARQAALASRQAARPSDSEQAEINRQMRALDDDMRALDREMRVLNDKMREFDKPMEDLGRDMDVLGREMDALGRKMEAASRKAHDDMRALLDRALATGAAQPVR